MHVFRPVSAAPTGTGQAAGIDRASTTPDDSDSTAWMYASIAMIFVLLVSVIEVSLQDDPFHPRNHLSLFSLHTKPPREPVLPAQCTVPHATAFGTGMCVCVRMWVCRVLHTSL